MRVSEAMTRQVRIASPDQSIGEAAKMMEEAGVGSIPVGENDRLVGIVTDRDIAVRAVAKGKDLGTTTVRDVMSSGVKYCFEDQEVSDVARNMGDVQLHRLPVLNADKRLVGIIALADIANCDGAQSAGDAVCGISHPAAGASSGASSAAYGARA